jgi:transposase
MWKKNKSLLQKEAFMGDEVSRYQQFCQLKQEIRGSSDYLIVGIDVAKDKHHAFFGTANGKTLLKRLIFENDKNGFDRLLSQTALLRVHNGLSKAVFGLEPTGNYHKSLAEWLLSQGQQLVMVAGKAVRDNRELLDNRWDKHDTKDSANVADLISQGKCMFYETPDSRICEIRNLLGLRRRLKKQEHSFRMRIRNSLVTKFFPEMDRHLGAGIEENLLIVEKCLDPRKINAMTFPDFVKRVTTTDRGTRQLTRLRSIYEAAGRSVGLPMEPSDEYEARLLVEELRAVRKHISHTMEKIEILCNEFESYRYLQTIPGYGPYISALVLGTIGDPFRFNNFNQVKRLAGLDLCASRSGKTSDQAVPVISKRGDADLRYALYQAALLASYHNKDFRELFNRILRGRERERGIKTKMRVKLAEKMLVIAWTIMKKQESFTPLYLRVANTAAEA